MSRLYWYQARRRVHNLKGDFSVGFELADVDSQSVRQPARFRVGGLGKEKTQASGADGLERVADRAGLLSNRLGLDILPFVLIPVLKACPLLSPGHCWSSHHSAVKIANYHT